MMEDDRTTAPQDIWPMRPLVFGVMGAAAGKLLHSLGAGDIWKPEISALTIALLAFFFVAPTIFALVAERRSLRISVLFSLGCGLLAALIAFWNGPGGSWSSGDMWRFACLMLSIAIAAPLFQAWREAREQGAGRPRFPYAAVHRHAWTNVILWCLGWLFVGLTMLMTWLLAELFELIGLHFLTNLLEKGGFMLPLIGAALGVALGRLRELHRVVASLQNVATTVLNVLGLPLAIGLGFFLVALPFTGLQALWDATRATTPILLSCAAGALILVNAVVDNGPEEESRNRVFRWAALALALCILPLAVIAAIATGLRISQYGLSPERLWAVVFVALATAYGLAYLVSLVRARHEWPAAVRISNLRLAFGMCGLALFLATPLSGFNWLSTRDQVRRLETGKVSPEKFDWGALAFDFGAPGKAAVRRLAASRDASVRALAAKALASQDRWELAETRVRDSIDFRIRTVPASATVSPALKKLINENNVCGWDSTDRCTVAFVNSGTEALIFRDDCFAPLRDTKAGATTSVWSAADLSNCVAPERARATGQSWQIVADQGASALPAAQRRQVRQGYEQGKVEIRTVQRRQVYVGGVPVGSAFE